jgi:hypothetical protein
MAVDEYQFRIKHRKGKDMLIADALSRDPAFEVCEVVQDRRELMPPDLLRRSVALQHTAAVTVALIGGQAVLVTTRAQEAAAAAEPVVAGPVEARVEDGQQLWQWAGSETAAAVTTTLQEAAVEARCVQLPGWAEMGWGELPACEAELLPQAQEMRRQQLADATMGPVLRWLETGQAPAGVSPEEGRRVRQRGELHRVVGGLLHHVPVATIFGDAAALQLAIPETAREQLLRRTHAGVLGAHVGFA